MNERLLKEAARNALEAMGPEGEKAFRSLAAQVALDLPITPPTTDESIVFRGGDGIEYVLGHVVVKPSYYVEDPEVSA